MTPSDPQYAAVEIRIEWRDSVADAEIGRTANFSPVLTGAYQEFEITGTVPDGADTARLTYAMQSFSVLPVGEAVVYVDDMSFPAEDPVSAEGSTWGHLKGLFR